jgi:hypothetical protein
VPVSKLTYLTFLEVPAERSFDAGVVALQLFMRAHRTFILDSVALETEAYQRDKSLSPSFKQ